MSVGSVEKIVVNVKTWRQKININYTTKLCSTLPIENAQKIKIVNDYSEEICLAIDDNNDKSNIENMDL